MAAENHARSYHSVYSLSIYFYKLLGGEGIGKGRKAECRKQRAENRKRKRKAEEEGGAADSCGVPGLECKKKRRKDLIQRTRRTFGS